MGDGLGLGLSLVSSLARLHGGRAAARSDGPGRGSEFSVHLPLAPAARAGEKRGSQRPAPGLARRILVVDDNHDAARSLAMLLSTLGHETRTAFDSQEAQETAAAFEPEVVLLDIGLPDVDGYDTCRRMRGHAWAQGALFVAVTGWGQDEDKLRALEAGFDAHLTKPVELRLLRELLASP